MSEMVELVAKAIHQERFGGQLEWGRYPDAEKECLEEAYEAIKAMREPTDEMGEAADEWASMGTALKCWQVMIDEALK